MRATPSPEQPLLGEALCAAFHDEKHADYQPSHADEQALRKLLQLASGDEAEVERRYRTGLRRTAYPRVVTWVDLAKHWNACVPPVTTVSPSDEGDGFLDYDGTYDLYSDIEPAGGAA